MHTKGPWRPSHIQPWGIETLDKDIIRCYGANAEANVNRIVLCVNSHDELLADMERIVSWCLHKNDCKAEILHCASAAIAKARGE